MKEKTIKRDKIFEGVAIKLFVDTVELPNGKTSVREIVEVRNSVGVIAITKDNKLVLVKQYRKAIEQVVLEIPAGCIDKGETPLECARRELLEETGYGNGTIELVDSFYPSAGTNKTEQHLYLMKDVELISENQDLDEDEFVEVELLTFDELKKLYEEKQLCDLKTMYAYMYLSSYVN